MKHIIQFWIWFFYTLYRVITFFMYLVPRMVFGGIIGIFRGIFRIW